MIVGVISDTHDRLQSINAAFTFFAQNGVQHIIHCGDWKSLSTLQYFIDKATDYALPVSAVLGNNDHDVDAMTELVVNVPGFEIKEGVLELTLDGKRCAVYHGHHTPTLRTVMQNEACDIIFLGHTHKPKIEMNDDRLIVNPGSTAFSIPRSKAFAATIALVDTTSKKAEIIKIS